MANTTRNVDHLTSLSKLPRNADGSFQRPQSTFRSYGYVFSRLVITFSSPRIGAQSSLLSMQPSAR